MAVVIKIKPQPSFVVHHTNNVPIAVIERILRRQRNLLANQHQVSIFQRQRNTSIPRRVHPIENQPIRLVRLKPQLQSEIVLHSQFILLQIPGPSWRKRNQSRKLNRTPRQRAKRLHITIQIHWVSVQIDIIDATVETCAGDFNVGVFGRGIPAEVEFLDWFEGIAANVGGAACGHFFVVYVEFADVAVA